MSLIIAFVITTFFSNICQAQIVPVQRVVTCAVSIFPNDRQVPAEFVTNSNVPRVVRYEVWIGNQMLAWRYGWPYRGQMLVNLPTGNSVEIKARVLYILNGHIVAEQRGKLRTPISVKRGIYINTSKRTPPISRVEL